MNPEDVLRLAFDTGWLWGDVAHVMDLTIPELLLYAEHAQRLLKARVPRG